MKQIARIAKTRCQLLLELLYIQSSVQRPRLASDFLSCQKTAINKYYRTTHLSAGKLSGLMILPVTFFFVRFLSSNFAFPRPKNQNLKIFRHGADTNAYNFLLLGQRLVVLMSICFCQKECRVVSGRFVVMEQEKILSFHASKYPMKL